MPIHKMSSMLLSTVLLVVCAGGVLSAQIKSKCIDQPVMFFLRTEAQLPDGGFVPSAITGDGNSYDGSIMYCSGTYDAVLNLLVSKRKLTIVFPSAIPGSYVDTPIPAGLYQRNGVINVRNLICRNCGVDAHQPFTTRVGVEITSLLNRHDFKLRFMPFSVDAPDLHKEALDLPELNTPYSTSQALVIPQPYDCLTGGMVKPAWVVRGTMPNNDPSTLSGFGLQVGTAHDVTVTPNVRAGQYSMPFELRIEAARCFSY